MGDLARSRITRPKLILEGDVSSRGVNGEDLRGWISLFNGSICRSHKIPPVVDRSCECTRASRPRPMGNAMGQCCSNELSVPDNNLRYVVLLSVKMIGSSRTFHSLIRWFSTALPFLKTARTLSEVFSLMVCHARDLVLLVSTKRI